METRGYKVYKYHELTDDQKQLVLNNYGDINVDFEWYDCTYEDAKTIGVNIDQFDLERNTILGYFISDAEDTAEKIVANHGSMCETFLTAVEYKKNRGLLVVKHSEGIDTDRVDEDNEYEFDQECNELDAEFLKSLSEDYRIILQKEYDYLTTEEAIIATIDANEYDFTEDGKID